MSLRIGVDLDGVLADMDSELVRQAGLIFGESVASGPDSETPASGDSNTRASSDPDASESGTDMSASDDSVHLEPSLPALRLTTRQQRRLWHHIASIDNFWETLKEIEPGSIARLAVLAIDR